ncbi:LVIVD repeat-containing protein [Haladaptatus paucihalophilus DX253]|uniref:LVIVD repeat-containing protein n=2 Tax=Haladaptatus paucihalophilus TaxID=367189 RepID=A0A1M6PIQ6_HALPU|nr:LVIVD repeat-containing protein [Haladaptatus paucihalophilus DX253]
MKPLRDTRTRRRVLRRSGAVLVGSALAGCSTIKDVIQKRQRGKNTSDGGDEATDVSRLSLRKRGQAHLSAGSSPSGGYSEVSVRKDGKYAVVGTKWGTTGTVLVDVSDSSSLKQVHYLGNSNDAPNIDVKFDSRNGLYHRAIEKTWSGNFEIVDYGFSAGTPTNPTVVGSVSDGKSHNVRPHPTKPVLYTMNYGLESNGFDVYDVSDPTSPRKLGEYGPQGAGHDINVDPERDLLCCAYQSGQFIGFIIYDVSDPRNPTEIGRFDYTKRKSYDEANVGEEAFGAAHHGHFDPRRDLLVLGDERPQGVPGGKHVFDIGWKNGSLKNPVPVGFTVSPNARRMEDEYAERFDWTGHHFDIVPKGEATLVASADWHEGVVVYDITDPTTPTPVDRYRTDDGVSDIRVNDEVSQLGKAPMAWKTEYNEERDFIVASDTFTGLYTFELTS